MPHQVDGPNTQTEDPENQGHMCLQAGQNEESDLKEAQESQENRSVVSKQNGQSLDTSFDVILAILSNYHVSMCSMLYDGDSTCSA